MNTLVPSQAEQVYFSFVWKAQDLGADSYTAAHESANRCPKAVRFCAC
jgi:hypothetical protein